MSRDYLKAIIKGTVSENLSDAIEALESSEDLEEGSPSTDSVSLRSPSGTMRGYSVKEYEEQLSNLKKENFNLKLRIYFLEERMGGNFKMDKENILKKNVELKVEVESLRQEVKEKHTLLCQAVKVIDLEDEEHKKVVGQKNEAIAKYEREIKELQEQFVELRQQPEPNQAVADNSTEIKTLEEKVCALEAELSQEKENNFAIQMVLDEKDTKLRSLETELEEFKKRAAKYEVESTKYKNQLDEAKTKSQMALRRLHENKSDNDELINENEDLRKRYTLLRTDLEREQKRYDKLKVSSDQKLVELQTKLDSYMIELKKSQQLVVSKSVANRSRNTDADSFSVQKPAASPRSTEKEPNILPTFLSPVVQSQSSSSVSSLTPTSPLSPLNRPSFLDDTLNENTDYNKIIEFMKADKETLEKKIVKLKAEQMKACNIIRSMIDTRKQQKSEIADLKQKNEQLERELENCVSRPEGDGINNNNMVVNGNLPQIGEEHSMEESGDLVEQYKALTQALEEKNQVLTETLIEKDTQMKKVQEQYGEILESLQKREDHIVDLEFELLSVKQQANSDETVQNYITQLAEKDREIDKLNGKLLKRNCDLQGLVNNELWEKNREIEKLQKMKTSKALETTEQIIAQLQSDVAKKEEQLRIITEKISEFGLEVDLSGDDVIKNWGNVQSELEKSEKLRLEANERCNVLCRRLEELAIFLDSLLKQKSVLGFLGNKENKKIREIIDQSLDLSRSFTMSMMVNCDQSLTQLTDISNILNQTGANSQSSIRLSLIPTDVTLTYQSHLHRKLSDDKTENSEIIDTLRQQIVNLKYELQLRDVELSKLNAPKEVADEKSALNNNTSSTLKFVGDNHSESESWSEPDRTVSKARMGHISDRSCSNLSKNAKSNNSSDSEELIKSPRTPPKKTVLNESRNTIIELHKQLCDLDQKYNDKEIAYNELMKLYSEEQTANNKLKQQLDNLEIQLKDTETKLIEAESKKVEAELRLDFVQKTVEDLEVTKSDLIASMANKDKELQNRINEIEVERERAVCVAKEAEVVAEAAKKDMKEAEVKLRTMQDEMRLVEEHYNECLMKVKRESEDLQSALDHYKERIANMIKQEETNKEKLKLYQDKINGLRHDLDKVTIQYSEAVLEKTALSNEKLTLEQDTNKKLSRHQEIVQELADLRSELNELKQQHTKQQSNIQQQKSKLEVRVSELESLNAELHNKLIKLQSGCGGDAPQFSTSLPNASTAPFTAIYRRQYSDNSCYNSEEHVLEEFRIARTFMSGPRQDMERHEANSSPDLGIESDHGRFSSLETHMNVARPLLQTLELTESMNNLLDDDNSQVQTINCDHEHCCRRTMEMAHENNELKRKLLRTRRALESTVTQLTLANQMKKQVEKTICKQIHKTSQVLRKAKANLDSGSETDIYKK